MARDPAKHRARQLKYIQKKRSESRSVCYLERIKNRAKEKGVPFDLKLEDINWPTNCPALGLELDYSENKTGKPRDNAPSLDRISPKRGYVKGNVAVISVRANRLKSDSIDGDELRAVANYIDLWVELFA